MQNCTLKIKKLITKSICSVVFMFSLNGYAQSFLDTQYGPDGVEVHLLKASVANSVITVAFMIENTTGAEVEIKSLNVADALYTTAGKKYPVLKDNEEKWLASTITYEKDSGSDKGFIFANTPGSYLYFRLKEDGRKVGWVKFEAPGDDEWPIEVSLPGTSPFTIEKPE